MVKNIDIYNKCIRCDNCMRIKIIWKTVRKLKYIKIVVKLNFIQYLDNNIKIKI